MRDVIEHFKSQFKRKRKRLDVDEPGSDHPAHEQYVKQKPRKE